MRIAMFLALLVIAVAVFVQATSVKPRLFTKTGSGRCIKVNSGRIVSRKAQSMYTDKKCSKLFVVKPKKDSRRLQRASEKKRNTAKPKSAKPIRALSGLRPKNEKKNPKNTSAKKRNRREPYIIDAGTRYQNVRVPVIVASEESLDTSTERITTTTQEVLKKETPRTFTCWHTTYYAPCQQIHQPWPCDGTSFYSSKEDCLNVRYECWHNFEGKCQLARMNSPCEYNTRFVFYPDENACQAALQNNRQLRKCYQLASWPVGCESINIYENCSSRPQTYYSEKECEAKNTYKCSVKSSGCEYITFWARGGGIGICDPSRGQYESRDDCE